MGLLLLFQVRVGSDLQLSFRNEYLTDGTAIYQRSDRSHKKAYADWGRGAVWYLLGTVKTLALLENSPFADLDELGPLKQKFVEEARRVAELQNDDGLWYGFLARPKTLVDTTATAGIGAAFAWGQAAGFLDEKYRERASRAREACFRFLTPDGFLGQATQINRGWRGSPGRRLPRDHSICSRAAGATWRGSR